MVNAKKQTLDSRTPIWPPSGSDAQVHAERSTGAIEPEATRAKWRPKDDSPAFGLKREIQDIARQLSVGAVVTPEAGKPQAPVLGAWQRLQAIDSIRPERGAPQLAEVEHELRAAITLSTHSSADMSLLLEVVARITRPEGPALGDFMANKVYTGLLLPNLQMVAPGEKEPNSRVFNSILPNLAELAYDHNPLGRTLLWEGACALFDGPRQADRRDRLRKVVFNFPNVPNEGESKLATPYDFMLAVDELEVDEDVDLVALREKS